MSTQYRGSVLSSTEQPTSSSVAQGIWNTSDIMQALQASTWPLNNIPMEYLVLAGGGAGAAGNSGNVGNGGGGAGGLLTNTINIIPANAYTFTVGAGATGTVAGLGNVASNGSNSVISGTGITTITALGGGSAMGYRATASSSNSGGSGGGGSYNTVTAGSGTAGPPRQGYNGGAGINSGTYAGGGGGGAGGAGVAGSVSGNGGIGAQSSITGTATYYGGGGGGGALSGTAPTGGSGGGGAGGLAAAGVAGTANLGGGGGGAANVLATGANGGSGVIIIAYPSSYASASAVSAGLTVNGSAGNTTPDTASRAGYKIYKITAGTGTITW
jgi:hypothetical protein